MLFFKLHQLWILQYSQDVSLCVAEVCFSLKPICRYSSEVIFTSGLRLTLKSPVILFCVVYGEHYLPLRFVPRNTPELRPPEIDPLVFRRFPCCFWHAKKDKSFEVNDFIKMLVKLFMSCLDIPEIILTCYVLLAERMNVTRYIFK